jgi:hypothetical protein
VTTHKKTSFVTDRSFFEKFGFEVVDEAPPIFRLMALRLNKDAPAPRFHDNAKSDDGQTRGKRPLKLVVTDQCPFTDYWPTALAAVANGAGQSAEVVRLTTRRAAQTARSAYGTFSLEHRGERLSHSIPGPSTLKKYLANLT